MFKVENQAAVGKYLGEKIDSRFKSRREFCKEFLNLEGVEPSEENLGKMSNKFSQIIKGNKGVQTYDLPFICELLDMTCEELLSAGKFFVPKVDRMTNYTVAFSKDPKVWEKYVKRDDKLILNFDEYNKSVVDYALKFGNYGFLKYLLDKGYIKFDSGNQKEYFHTFGACTTIERRPIHMLDNYLDCELREKDKLRMDLIALALENKDFCVLNKLRARETPELYLGCGTEKIPDFVKESNERLLNAIASSSDEVVDYFTDEFEITSPVEYNGSKVKNRYMFIYLPELLDKLVEKNHPFTEFALRKAKKHNDETYNALKDIISRCIDNGLEGFNFDTPWFQFGKDKEEIKRGIVAQNLREVFMQYYKEKNDFVQADVKIPIDGIKTNIIRVNAASEKPRLKYLIEDLNESYYKIKNIREEFSFKEEQ